MKAGLRTRSTIALGRKTESWRVIPPATDSQLLDPNQYGPMLFHYSDRYFRGRAREIE